MYFLLEIYPYWFVILFISQVNFNSNFFFIKKLENINCDNNMQISPIKRNDFKKFYPVLNFATAQSKEFNTTLINDRILFK